MSRRSGQSGYIERKGNAFRVRFWMDVPGQQTRKHMAVRICPVSGPGTINNVLQVVKMVVASAINDEGEEIYPRKWNHEFIDLPEVKNQHRPTHSGEGMDAIIASANGQYKMLYALLAGTGMRAGEVSGLEIGKHISPDASTIMIQQSVWCGDVQTPKTNNAMREIDLHSDLVRFLKNFIGQRKSGFLFKSRTGKPLTQTNVLKRSLHPILEAAGLPKAGFHAFRRFRTTWLRKNRAPEDLIRFWIGHSDKSMTDVYSKMSEDVQFRKECAEKVGLGFATPSKEELLYPLYPKMRKNKGPAIVSQALVAA